MPHGSVKDGVVPMRKPSNLRISSYISEFDLPGKQYACAVHGYSVAIDVLQSGLAENLKDNNLKSCLEDSAVWRLLEQRGYLTTKSDEEEKEFVNRIQQLFFDKQPFMVDFGITFSDDAGDYRTEPGFFDNLFMAMNELRGISVGSPLEIDLLKLNIAPSEVVPTLLSKAQEWDFKVHLIVSESQREEVGTLIDEGQVGKLSVYIFEPKDSWFTTLNGDTDSPFDHIRELISKQMQLEFLVNVDQLSVTALRSMVSNIRSIQSQIHSENEAQLIFIPITLDSNKRTPRLLSNGIGFLPLHPNEIQDYRQLEHHLWSPRVVRFRPCFAPSDRRFIAFSSGEIYLLTEFGHSSKLVGHISPDGYDIDTTSIEENVAGRTLSELPAECSTCKLSLMCGGNCNVWNSSVGEHFEQKMVRLLTVPFINWL